MKPILISVLLTLIIHNFLFTQGIYYDINPNILENYGNNQFYYDFDKDGVYDIEIYYNHYEWWATYKIIPAENTFVCTPENNPGLADTLNFWNKIDDELFWSSGECYLFSIQKDNGLWNETENKMAGIKKSINGGSCYGWVRMDVNWSILKIKDYCYNPIIDECIYAGIDAMYRATDILAADIGDNKNGSDLNVACNSALFEDDIYEYRLISVKSEDSASFNIDIANQIPPENYLSILPSGSNINVTLNQDSRDADGDLIINLQTYNIFVLSLFPGQNGDSSVLSNPTLSFMLTTEPATADSIIGSDINDYGDGRDLMISFNNIEDETTISEYGVVIVEHSVASEFDLELANSLPEDWYITIIPTGQPIELSCSENTKDSQGNLLKSGGYYVFVISIAEDQITEINSFSRSADAVCLKTPLDKTIYTGEVSSNMIHYVFDPAITIEQPDDGIEQYYFDANFDSVNDFRFTVETWSSPWGTFPGSYARGIDLNQIVGDPLPLNIPIINDMNWRQKDTLCECYLACYGPWCGNYYQEPKYMPGRFFVDGDTLLAWFKLNVGAGRITLYEYAYLNISTLGLVENFAGLQDLIIYPNPVTDLLYIKFNSVLFQNFESFLYNNQGKQIIYKKSESNNMQIDVSKLKSGIYLLHVISRYGDSVTNIIVIR
ncbi:MAG: T9SS type A sorting domain-containing protein [Bacteroidales bacterium]|nr:T9SS type A sorting domain-containing protein [Bacteroidales bacterium]